MDYRRITTILVAIFTCFVATEKILSFLVQYILSGDQTDELVPLLDGRGEIRAAAYYYTTVGDIGHPIEILLEPKIGDVDLYVSSKSSPTYELNNHDIGAASCGNEQISVPKDFVRPFYVGVYCYNIYDNCTFYLTIAARYPRGEVPAGYAKPKVTGSSRKIKSTFLAFIEVLFESLVSFI